MNPTLPPTTSLISWGQGNWIGLLSNSGTGTVALGSFDKMESSTTGKSGNTSQARKLVFETHGIFRFLHTEGMVQQNLAEKQAQLLLHSNMYRAALSSLSSDVRHTLYSNLASVWHLCEIFFLHPPSELAAPLLMDWCRRRQIQSDIDILRQAISTNRDYWPSIYRFTAIGNLSPLKELLEIPNFHNSKAVPLVKSLISQIPSVDLVSTTTYQSKLKSWLQNCQLAMAQTSDHKEIQEVLRIFQGDEDALQRHTTSWMDHLVALILYKFPNATLSSCEKIVRNILRKTDLRTADIHQSISELFLAIIKRDARECINKFVSSIWNDCWFSAHMYDLLVCSGVLEPVTIQTEGEDEREMYILNYVSWLLTNQGFTSVIATYLLHGCPTQGDSYLRLLIQKTPIVTERDAHRVLSLCRRSGLMSRDGIQPDDYTVKSIQRAMGTRFRNCNRHESAMHWYREADDSVMMLSQATTVLNAHFKPIHVSKIEKSSASTLPTQIRRLNSAIDALQGPVTKTHVPLPMLTPIARPLDKALMFLHYYRKALVHYERSEFEESIEVITAMLIQNIAPRQFWAHLVQDALFLADICKYVIPTNNVFILLRCVEKLSVVSATGDSTEINSLKLRLTGQLGKSMLIQQPLAKMNQPSYTSTQKQPQKIGQATFLQTPTSTPLGPSSLAFLDPQYGDQ